MTKLLKEAFEQAAKLGNTEQDSVAQWILAELASEKRWGDSFHRSPDLLGTLAEEALAEHRAGRTRPLDPDSI